MRVGTRRSALALAQAKLVSEQLGDCEIVPIVTSGDRRRAAPAGRSKIGEPPGRGLESEDKSRWVRELEDALLSGEIDLAVHSAKDVPSELAEGLALLGAPARAAVEDALCGAPCLDDLAHGARVGTSSIRRAAQLRAVRDDLDVVAIRGNVDTRLRKLADSDDDGFQAIVLARAGLQRLGKESEIGAVLDPERFVPAPGQGVLALQGRADDASVGHAVREITDPQAFACLLAERAVARALDASCHTPLGAYAVADDGSPRDVMANDESPGGAGNGSLRLRAWVGLPDGSAWACDELVGDDSDPEALGREVAARLKLAGAGEILAQAEGMGRL